MGELWATKANLGFSYLIRKNVAIRYDVRLLVAVTRDYGAARVGVIRVSASGGAARFEEHQVGFCGLWCQTHLVAVRVLILEVVGAESSSHAAHSRLLYRHLAHGPDT